jgi:demethylmenaquinone methyltransferase / 2-methoxy-6-polyprenyl-1,4-benzoquinol methylase
MSSDNETHFGFEKIPTNEKTKKVADVFHSVAPSYDCMNDMMSFGIHRLWKQFAIELASVRLNHWVLDLAAGTGDLSLKLAPLLGERGRLFVTDINESMLLLARTRMIEKGLTNNVYYLQVNAESIPFPDNLFDCITIGFGLRNVTDKQTALSAMYRVLKPGGKIIILEFSQPYPGISFLYDLYSFKVLPLLGKLVAKDEKSYRYLAESIRMHPNQTLLCHMMEMAGFQQCSYHNLTMGIVAIHRGYKLD